MASEREREDLVPGGQAPEDVVFVAFRDALTGLPTRALFLDRLTQALARVPRGSHNVGILMLDVDNFRAINHSLGHSAGDQVLVEVADSLSKCLRPSDTIARLGGDEFGVLLDEVADPRDVARAAERMLGVLGSPIVVDGTELYITVRIGIAIGGSSARPDALLRDADLALYRAKADKEHYRALEPRIDAEIVERLELELELNGAIERGELSLSYQPIFSLRTGTVTGLEALARWQHPTRGTIMPDRFIPLAEATGRIHDIGRWVLERACHQGALWRAKYPAMPGLQVGVNISGSQLRRPELVDLVADAMRHAGLGGDGLTLEVTETALMGDVDVAARRLDELKELGVDIAIDDFGTGYSSLRYLQQLPLDNLKIAKPFVDELGREAAKPPILRAILELADVFDLSPVAEGIDDPDHAAQLLELGCELGQGHALSPPLSPVEADELLLNVGLLGGVGSGAADAASAEVRPARSADDPAGAS